LHLLAEFCLTGPLFDEGLDSDRSQDPGQDSHANPKMRTLHLDKFRQCPAFLLSVFVLSEHRTKVIIHTFMQVADLSKQVSVLFMQVSELFLGVARWSGPGLSPVCVEDAALKTTNKSCPRQVIAVSWNRPTMTAQAAVDFNLTQPSRMTTQFDRFAKSSTEVRL
jgi:hypothetical protein